MAKFAMLSICVLLAAAPAGAVTAKKSRATAHSATAGARVTTTSGPTAPAPGSAAPAPGARTARQAEDSTLTLRGGQEGTVFKSLTVEGEDRIRLDVERPELKVELDPTRAPGLDWGSARDVLDRTVPDFSSPLVALSAHEPSPYVAHPWLSHFASGAVARFRPDVQGVASWKLTIVNARGETVATYSGRGEPPREIAWDGRSQGGAPVVPGLTYSYVLEAHDKAGNKRNFVGQGFHVNAYRLEGADGPLMVFSARELPAMAPGRSIATTGSGESATPPILLEAATWLNQRPKANQPVRVTATARSSEEAQALADNVTRWMAPHLIGDPARIQAVAEVQADTPEGGMVQIKGVR